MGNEEGKMFLWKYGIHLQGKAIFVLPLEIEISHRKTDQ